MINYIVGDATLPQESGKKVIIHIVNNQYKWGSGFVLAISKRWKQPEQVYRSQKQLVLGTVHYAKVDEDIVVANMIAQILPHPDNNWPRGGFGEYYIPLSYHALEDCLIKVNEGCIKANATIHAPRLGSGLAGGRWPIIESIINRVCTVETFIYDLPTGK
jgi:hypothetical protein